MRKIGKKEAETILKGYDGKTFTARHSQGMTQSGNYGWQSDYSVDGKPVIRIVTDNCHSFGAVYDIRETPAPATDSGTSVHA
jgi:hypothetical protein